ncbi:MAG: threonylcarbamoyl-AMP synthase [Bdellovibrionales bacterium]|nr:threonylcarbamoyl-AMP synthase [Bdellovibrionales bacterium]
MGPSLCSIEHAVQELNMDHVIGFPTETVYGLAGRVDRPRAIEKIFLLKQRPFFDPLIVHVESIEQAKALTREWPPVAQALAEKFWPGPLTLVLEKSASVSDIITSGLSSVGIRFPKHPLALQIVRAVGVPLAAPSANLFGHTSPTLAGHVLAEFPGAPLGVVDGGPCEVGIESTVLALKAHAGGSWTFSILRPGFISAKEVSEFLRAQNLMVPEVEALSKRESPGQMKHHYMPTKPLVLSFKSGLSDADICAAFLAELPKLPDEVEGVKIRKPKSVNLKVVRLSLSKDSRMAARELYAELRRGAESTGDLLFLELTARATFDLKNLTSTVDSDEDAFWGAIYERLMKAATLVIKTKAIN